MSRPPYSPSGRFRSRRFRSPLGQRLQGLRYRRQRLDPVAQAAAGIAALALQEAYRSGKTIEIPSLGIVIKAGK